MAKAANTESEARAAAWLKAWDGQGRHRTATSGDEAGAAWLAGEATKIAGRDQVTSETFHLERLDPVAAYVEAEGQRIDGEALFDGGATGSKGVRHSEIDGVREGPIVIRPLSPSAVYGAEYKQMRRESPYRAEIIVTTGGAPGLALLNAEEFRQPVGPPTVQVSSVALDRLVAVQKRGASLRVVVDTKRTPADARNIVVTIRGRDRQRPPVVVMTPRSSWWQSTAERGGGIVCWLEALRALQAAPPACDVIFTANSGHELGHLGFDAFVARRPGCEGKLTWIHFGANIGAVGSTLQIQSNQDDLRQLASDRLSAAGQQSFTLAETTNVPSGETKDIHRAGGRYVTLVAPPGTFALFHMPQDRWPDSVDVPAIARIAEAAANTVVALTR